MKSLKNKKPYEIGKLFEKKAINYLKNKEFKDIKWISIKKPNSYYDITAKKDNKFFYIEVRYTKSKKFQITKNKLRRLEKLNNVLFLLFSPSNIELIKLEDIKNKLNISINEGQINNLNIKKREINKNTKSLLTQFLDTKKIKIIDFLLDNYPLDFSKEEIARSLEISRKVIFNSWEYLTQQDIIKITRKFGKTKLYTLNSNNIITKRILDLEKALISKALEKEQKKELIISS